MIKDVYYVPWLEKNLLSIRIIVKCIPQLHINFSNNKWFIVDKNNKNMVSMGVEEQGLFLLI
jgi:hypothetical protein